MAQEFDQVQEFLFEGEGTRMASVAAVDTVQTVVVAVEIGQAWMVA